MQPVPGDECSADLKELWTAYETYSSVSSSLVVGPVVTELRDDGRDDSETGCQYDRSDEQGGLSTPVVNVKTGRNGEDKVDDSNDSSCQYTTGTLGQTDRPENGRRVAKTGDRSCQHLDVEGLLFCRALTK
jgi:hypothetical protein